MPTAAEPVTQSSGISIFGLAIVPLLLYILISLAITALVIVLIIRAIQALAKHSAKTSESPYAQPISTSLAQVLSDNRTRCCMTQEFVAEKLGLSRQAVSKWESGRAEPSTSNLIAIAKLYGIEPDELLRQVIK